MRKDRRKVEVSPGDDYRADFAAHLEKLGLGESLHEPRTSRGIRCPLAFQAIRRDRPPHLRPPPAILKTPPCGLQRPVNQFSQHAGSSADGQAFPPPDKDGWERSCWRLPTLPFFDIETSP